MPTPILRKATEADVPTITEIYNDVIATSTAIYRDDTVDVAERMAWFRTRVGDGFPVIVAELDGKVIGYTGYGSFRFGEGYKRTVEHTIHIHSAHRRKGLGRILLTEIMRVAKEDGRHVLVGGIDSENVGSIALHEKFGFEVTARMPEVAFKGGKLLTLVLMQKILD